MRSPANLLTLLAVVLLSAIGVVALGSLDGIGVSGEVLAAGESPDPAPPEPVEPAPAAREDSGWAVEIRTEILATAGLGPAQIALRGPASVGLPDSVPVWDGAGSPYAPRSSGRGLVRFSSRGRDLWRVVEVAPPEGGSAGSKPTRGSITLSGSGTLRLKVVDVGGAPVPGARAWVGLGDPGPFLGDGPGAGASRAEASSSSRSGPDGVLEVAVEPAGSGVPVLVAAPGQAPAFRVVEVPASGTAECAVILRPGVDVPLRLVGKAPRVAPRVWVAPADPGDTRAHGLPWLLWNRTRGGVARGQEPPLHTLRGVPDQLALKAAARHPGTSRPGKSVRHVAGDGDLFLPLAAPGDLAGGGAQLARPIQGTLPGLKQGLAYVDLVRDPAEQVDPAGVPLAVWGGERLWVEVGADGSFRLPAPIGRDAQVGWIDPDGRHLRRAVDGPEPIHFPWPGGGAAAVMPTELALTAGWPEGGAVAGSGGAGYRLRGVLGQDGSGPGPWQMVGFNEPVQQRFPRQVLLQLHLSWHAPDGGIQERTLGPMWLEGTQELAIGPDF